MSKFEFTCRFLDLAVPRAVHLSGSIADSMKS
jgi:hypothetical protein